MRFPIRTLSESLIIEKLEAAFHADTLTQLAKENGFMKRKGKFTALAFLQVCLLNACHACSRSLSGMCNLLGETTGIRIKKQSLDQRFNTASVSFLKKLVEELVVKQFSSTSKWNTSAKSWDLYKIPFNRVLIGDCTSFSVPTQYRDSYKGPGGIYTSAAAKLYYEYDFISGSLCCLTDTGWADLQTMLRSGPSQIKPSMI